MWEKNTFDKCHRSDVRLGFGKVDQKGILFLLQGKGSTDLNLE
jgi:hypothetical protein